MTKSNADYAVECAQQLSQHDPHRSALIRMSMAIKDLQAPQRTWVGLDEEEIQQVALTVDWTDEHVAWNFAIGIEELLKEKNA